MTAASENYSKFLQTATPEVLKAHSKSLVKEKNIGKIINSLISDWGAEETEQSRDLMFGLSKLVQSLSIDNIDLVLTELNNPALRENLEAAIERDSAAFVRMFDLENNPGNAFGLLLVANLVGDEYKLDLFRALSNLDKNIFIDNPELSAFYRYSVEKLMDSKGLGQQSFLRKLDSMIEAAEDMEREVAEAVQSEPYISEIDRIMDLISRDKISSLDLRMSMTMMPSLAITMATNFSSFPDHVRENLATNVFPALGDTPIGRLCESIVESRSSFDVRLNGEAEIAKSSVKDSNKALDKANKQIEQVNNDVKEGKVTRDEAKEQIGKIAQEAKTATDVESKKNFEDVKSMNKQNNISVEEVDPEDVKTVDAELISVDKAIEAMDKMISGSDRGM